MTPLKPSLYALAGDALKQTFQDLLVALVPIVATIGAPSSAQEALTMFLAQRYNLPEAILISIHSGEKPGANSWRLSYRNGLQGAEEPDYLIETRSVLLNNEDDSPANAVISWEIIRTRNNACVEETGSACPDMLRILSVPEGYMAVPESAWVDEGSGLEILIVPNGIG